MTSKGKRPLRSLTPSDKIQAIQRIHDGESKASVARDIGVPESTLRGWCKNEDKLRFMSRQSGPDKMGGDSLTDKIVDGAAAAAAAVSLLAGPPEKRQKLDTSNLPLNFSNKMKYDDLAYKRSPLNGLDFSTNKALSDLTFNGLGQDYSAFQKADLSTLNGSSKSKQFGADLTRQSDPSMAAISPLTSLSHLSGLTGLPHSHLALSFNDITSSLGLIAQQLNPSLAAISGLNGLNTNTTTMRNIKPKPPAHSPRNENDKPQGLSVKNWAKQKGVSENFGLNLSDKTKMKAPSPNISQSMGRDHSIEDSVYFWLKSQHQAILGLNNLYAPNPGSTSPPIRVSTPQQSNQTNTPPIISTPQTPSSTPSGSSDDTKNSAWFNWCKAFGASIMTDRQSLTPQNHHLNGSSLGSLDNSLKPQFENILYSHLTKESPPNSDNLNNNEITSSPNTKPEPEDLSAKNTIKEERSPRQSPVIKSEADTVTNNSKEILDNLLYKISNGNDSDASYNSDTINNNNSSSNNNNRAEDENGDISDVEDADEPKKALEHGEKFLKWLQICGNPRVTAHQIGQLKTLIFNIRSDVEKPKADCEQHTKIRRRK